MLRTLVADLQASGHSVTTLLDSRISVFKPPLEADHVIPVSYSGQTPKIMKEKARFVDASCIIAPESNGTLESMVANLQVEQVPSINCLSSAITKVTNKHSLLEHARRMGMSTPRSLVFKVCANKLETTKDVVEEMGFPIILKPIVDAGMAGLSLANSEVEVEAAIERIIQQSATDRFIAQEYVEGIPASVSLVTTGERAAVLSLNKQNVTLSSAYSFSKYEGGEVPLETNLKHETISTARRLIESLKGLRGYVGVDFVLTKETPVVIEVNPRLTTSYIGLRKTVSFNPAEAILNAALYDKLPSEKPNSGYACFAKVQMPSLASNKLHETYNMDHVVSPPFPISSEPMVSALVASIGTTLQEAATHLEKAKRKLLKIGLSGGTQG